MSRTLRYAGKVFVLPLVTRRMREDVRRRAAEPQATLEANANASGGVDGCVRFGPRERDLVTRPARPAPRIVRAPGPVYDSSSLLSHTFGAPSLSDDIPTLCKIFAENRVVAMVSLSASSYRLSHVAVKHLLDHGYHVIPVNRRYEEVFGQRCSLAAKTFPNPSTSSIASVPHARFHRSPERSHRYRPRGAVDAARHRQRRGRGTRPQRRTGGDYEPLHED